MSRTKFNSEAHIASLNALRAKLANTVFTSSTLRIEFKECGIPSNLAFWYFFQNSDIITKISEDRFCFSNPNKPIHFQKLEEVYKRYAEKQNQYQNKYRNKKKQSNIFKSAEIQAAIKLLNDNGMIVIAQNSIL